MRCDVLTAVLSYIPVISDVMPCSLVKYCVDIFSSRDNTQQQFQNHGDHISKGLENVTLKVEHKTKRNEAKKAHLIEGPQNYVQTKSGVI